MCREPALTPLRNPYKGLSAFQEADTEDFFGRSEAVSELVGLLTDLNWWRWSARPDPASRRWSMPG